MSRKAESAPTGVADAELAGALALLLLPMARLCLARGLPFPAAVELLKHAFVGAAREAHAGKHGPRDASRVSATTGISRREVTRISQQLVAPKVVKGSAATRVFTRWVGNGRLRGSDGLPKPLRRVGRAPSFEALSHSVTHDIHPGVILEELRRLGLVRVDAATDTVHLSREAFAPHEDKGRALGFLGSNVGDHMAAAVDNVLAERPPHMEQAIFADELSDESLAAFAKLVSAQWRTLMTSLVPQLQALVEGDPPEAPRARHRVRVGLYSFHVRTDAGPSETKE
ncbi:MAG TPA: DUF6502 family protein [Steroidobacteraceae bacterium]